MEPHGTPLEEPDNPMTDPAIHTAFGPASIHRKYRNKQALQLMRGLDVEAETPLIGMVCRLDDTSETSNVVAILDALVGLQVQFVAQGLGSSEGVFSAQAQFHRQEFAGIHQALSGQGTEARVPDCLHQTARPRTDTDVLNCGGTSQEAFCSPEKRTPVGALVVVSGLEWPNPLREPEEKTPAFG